MALRLCKTYFLLLRLILAIPGKLDSSNGFLYRYDGGSYGSEFKQAGESSWEAMELTDPHKPDRADELDRIQRCGGRVQMPGEDEPDGVPRLICPNAEIAMSRSMGDFQAASVGLVSEAEIGKEVLLKECDEHIILACSDGVWDVFLPCRPFRYAPSSSQMMLRKRPTSWFRRRRSDGKR